MHSIGMFKRRLTPAGAAAVLFTVVLATGSSAAPKPKATPASAEAALRALETERGKALLDADTSAIARMTGDDFIEINRLGQLRTKADNLHDLGTGELKLTSVHYDSLTVRTYGEVAILSGIADNTGSFHGFPFSGKIRYTRIFTRRAGRWQAVAMQHTPMP